ncbi:MAG: methylase [Myxococcales bacterium]|nr:methylase [Myxococcales bacterium]
MHHRRKTRPGRLRQLDALVRAWAPEVLDPEAPHLRGAPVVDLGIGAQPWTTLELVEAVAPLEVVGVDIAPIVVERARAYERPGLTFLSGSFDLPVQARLVRVMNVLRDLVAAEVPDAHRRIGASVLDGGLVIEGSCGPTGEAGVAHALRKRDGTLVREALLFWLDGTKGTAPLAFRDRLPRDLRGDKRHPAMALLHRWQAAYLALAPSDDRLARAAATADASLHVRGPGFVWAPPDGVPPTS